MKRLILLIEDNCQNSYMVSYLLGKNDCKVISASDGPAGIKMAEKYIPDLILLDIQLPGMDGYSVARELKASSTLKKIPIIAITSHAMAGDRQKAFSAGCDGYIEKPINPDSFVEEIEKYFKG
ncbi:MAG: response regulator [Elusimicrobiota bacterium]